MAKLIEGMDVSRETNEKLEHFAELLAKWTKKINLISSSTLSTLWERHILDSAQVFQIAHADWKTWTDIGSGGGLPGLVVAILDTKNRSVTLIESDQRKALFLNTVRRELDLNVTVLCERVEAASLSQSDVLSARALAPLNQLLEYSEQIVATDGVCIFPKGQNFQEELDQAHCNWHFDLIRHQSATSANSQILELSRIRRREVKPDD